jgi:hypothetical protein
MRSWAAAFAIAIIAAGPAIAGCGGGGEVDKEVSTPTFSEDETTPPDATYPEPTVPEDAPQPPKGASPVLKEIYRQFTPPEPDPRFKGSARAIAAGKAACTGRTPVEVERRYYPIAVRKGNLDPDSDKAKMIAQIERFARTSSRDSSFVAGQLAAGAYQATLPTRIAAFGYQGCVYALARQLQRELAPRK